MLRDSFSSLYNSIRFHLCALQRCSAGWSLMLQVNTQQIARLSQYLLPVPGNQRFLSCNGVFQLHVAFLGLHFWALVFYSLGDIVGLRRHINIDLRTDFVRA